MTNSLDDELHKTSDELHRLAEEFRKLVGESNAENRNGVHLSEKTTAEQLVQRYGLTMDEAKAWIEQEPDYKSSDDWKHVRKSDDKVTEP